MSLISLYLIYHIIFGFLLIGVYGSIKHRLQESLTIKNCLTILFLWPILLLMIVGVLISIEFSTDQTRRF